MNLYYHFFLATSPVPARFINQSRRYDAAKLHFFHSTKLLSYREQTKSNIDIFVFFRDFLSQTEQRHDQPQQADKEQRFDEESDKTAEKGER